MSKAELDLDAVRIDKVEPRPDADIADLRARDLASVKPMCPRLQVLERFGDKSEMIQASSRLEVLLEAERSGESVAAVCRRYRISRETYYRYRRRYLAAGMEGLEDRSRRPRLSPAQIDAALEAEIRGMRRDHARWGARRIHTELVRAGREAPAVSTIHQVLRRNHLVADQPPRRPKALLRFEREVANDLWQIDATEVRLADQHKAYVLDVIDDHSRYLLAAVTAHTPSTEAAWDCFEDAASR